MVHHPGTSCMGLGEWFAESRDAFKVEQVNPNSSKKFQINLDCSRFKLYWKETIESVTNDSATEELRGHVTVAWSAPSSIQHCIIFLYQMGILEDTSSAN